MLFFIIIIRDTFNYIFVKHQLFIHLPQCTLIHCTAMMIWSSDPLTFISLFWNNNHLVSVPGEGEDNNIFFISVRRGILQEHRVVLPAVMKYMQYQMTHAVYKYTAVHSLMHVTKFQQHIIKRWPSYRVEWKSLSVRWSPSESGDQSPVCCWVSG